MSFLSNTLITAVVGVSLLTGTAAITHEHQANAENISATVDAVCSTPLVAEALALTAGTGDGAAFDAHNATCTKLGSELAPALESLAVSFDAALGTVPPEVQSQVDAIAATLDDATAAQLSTMTPEAQVQFLFSLTAEGGGRR